MLRMFINNYCMQNGVKMFVKDNNKIYIFRSNERRKDRSKNTFIQYYKLSYVSNNDKI